MTARIISVGPFKRWGRPTLVALLSVIGLCVAGIQLVRQAAPRRPPAAIEISEAAGGRLGRELAGAFPEGGEMLVVQDRSSAAARVVADRELAGLRAGLGPAPFALATAGPGDTGSDGPGRLETISASAFSDWVRSRSGAVAVVSFVGVPVGTTAVALRGAPPLFALFYGGYGHWLPLMREGAMAGVVVPARRAAGLVPAPGRWDADPLAALGYRYVGREAVLAGP